MQNDFSRLYYNELDKLLHSYFDLLTCLIEEKESAVKRAPARSIRISVSDRRKPQFYLRTDSKERSGKYIRHRDLSKYRLLLQKKYDLQLLKQARLKQKELEPLMQPRLFQWDEPAAVFYDLCTCIGLPDDEFRRRWETAGFTPKPFVNVSSEFFTEKGERVRSKSEVLLANMLLRMDIPYRYECPLTLAGGVTLHPDFTLLSVKHHREFYWEHLGMMDDAEYVRSALKRINDYKRSGLFPGRDLILTHETMARPINIRDVENEIRAYIL